MQQPCSECGKPATHKVVKIIDGQLEESFYCDEHAPGHGSIDPQTHLQVSLEELLNSLLAQAGHSDSAEGSEEADFKCGACGLPYSLYKKTMILGCDRCYESFHAQMEHELRRMHGADTHVGRQPKNFVPPSATMQAQPVIPDSESATTLPPTPAPTKPPEESRSDKVARLQKEMAAAVESEDFESAARLRDQINALKTERTDDDE